MEDRKNAEAFTGKVTALLSKHFVEINNVNVIKVSDDLFRSLKVGDEIAVGITKVLR